MTTVKEITDTLDQAKTSAGVTSDVYIRHIEFLLRKLCVGKGKASGNRKRGKAAETALAKYLGARRVGFMQGEDLEHPVYSIEVKSRNKSPVEGWMRQAQQNAGDKVPIAIIHLYGQRHDNDIVCMRLTDWIKEGK